MRTSTPAGRRDTLPASLVAFTGNQHTRSRAFHLSLLGGDKVVFVNLADPHRLP